MIGKSSTIGWITVREGAVLPKLCRIPLNTDGAGLGEPSLFEEHGSTKVEGGSGLTARGVGVVVGVVAPAEVDRELSVRGAGMAAVAPAEVDRKLSARGAGMVVDVQTVWHSEAVKSSPASGSIMTSSSPSSLCTWFI